jgi:hypothetical protein
MGHITRIANQLVSYSASDISLLNGEYYILSVMHLSR